MWILLQYLVLSLILIGSVHYIYLSFQNETPLPDLIFDKEKHMEERKNIMAHLKEDEAETDELTQYVKDKIKVLNTPHDDNVSGTQ